MRGEPQKLYIHLLCYAQYILVVIKAIPGRSLSSSLLVNNNTLFERALRDIRQHPKDVELHLGRAHCHLRKKAKRGNVHHLRGNARTPLLPHTGGAFRGSWDALRDEATVTVASSLLARRRAAMRLFFVLALLKFVSMASCK